MKGYFQCCVDRSVIVSYVMLLGLNLTLKANDQHYIQICSITPSISKHKIITVITVRRMREVQSFKSTAIILARTAQYTDVTQRQRRPLFSFSSLALSKTKHRNSPTGRIRIVRMMSVAYMHRSLMHRQLQLQQRQQLQHAQHLSSSRSSKSKSCRSMSGGSCCGGLWGWRASAGGGPAGGGAARTSSGWWTRGRPTSSPRSILRCISCSTSRSTCCISAFIRACWTVGSFQRSASLAAAHRTIITIFRVDNP